MDSPTVEKDQRFVGRKIAKIGLVGLSTRNVGSLIQSVGLSVCGTITRRNIEMTPYPPYLPQMKHNSRQL